MIDEKLQDSYRACEEISRQSGSNFFRSFSLLRPRKRQAMLALYAFARLVDDWGDAAKHHTLTSEEYSTPESIQTIALPKNAPQRSNSSNSLPDEASQLHNWIQARTQKSTPETSDTLSILIAPQLHRIAIAIEDTLSSLPTLADNLHEIVDGVALDCTSTVRIRNEKDLDDYCYLVASSVGLACITIWGGDAQEVRQQAIDCGIAFQLTNILRDVKEDAKRDRIYVPLDMLSENEISVSSWLSGSPDGDWESVLRALIERAKRLYESGWQVIHSIDSDSNDSDGQRMFSLIWRTYRALLTRIEQNLDDVWNRRISLPGYLKTGMFLSHALTPLFRRLRSPCSSNGPGSRCKLSSSVIVVGGGLAGMAATLSLTNAGFDVTLIESKRQIGGRTGSFQDPVTLAEVDYCQHVGMVCCTNLTDFLDRTSVLHHWKRESTLHFYSHSGSHFAIKAARLPAPFHLSSLLLRWPDLRTRDRIKIAYGLMRLMRLKTSVIQEDELAIDWLRRNSQSETAIKHFWATILVSALGDQIDRVTLSATHKVLIEGFAAHRDAYQLLVPKRPLSTIFDDKVRKRLEQSGAKVLTNTTVDQLIWEHDQCIGIVTQSQTQIFADRVIIAVPWYAISKLCASDHSTPQLVSKVIETKDIQSSPITGVHLWWDRRWLDQPHAILVNRLCQWIFAPDISKTISKGDSSEGSSQATTERSNAPHEDWFYCQVVISGSRDLPKGNSQQVIDEIVKEINELFPRSKEAQLLRSKVVTDPRAVFSIPPNHQSTRLANDVGEDLRIWLAGDWTKTNWPATMEGAIRSGYLAAQSVIDHYAKQDEPNSIDEWNPKNCSLVRPDLQRGIIARMLIRN